MFVDTAAVMEKPLAQAAGLGWQGKHTNLVSREFGSWLFLGAIFTTLDLPRDDADDRPLRLVPGLPRHLPDRGVSRRPTSSMRGAAFPISPSKTRDRSRANFAKPSATASMAATIASRSAPGTSSRKQGREAKLAARDELRAPTLAELARLDDAAFRALFAKSPVKRIGRDRFVRNVLIAIGNSGDAALADEAERLLGDESPLVRGAAVWALSQLMRAKNSTSMNATATSDDSVREEWQAASYLRQSAKRGISTPRPRCDIARVLDRPFKPGDAPLMLQAAHNSVMVRARMTNQPFFTRDGDAFIPNPSRQRPVGSEIAARPRHRRPARLSRSSSATAATTSCRRG